MYFSFYVTFTQNLKQSMRLLVVVGGGRGGGDECCALMMTVDALFVSLGLFFANAFDIQ